MAHFKWINLVNKYFILSFHSKYNDRHVADDHGWSRSLRLPNRGVEIKDPRGGEGKEKGEGKGKRKGERKREGKEKGREKGEGKRKGKK